MTPGKVIGYYFGIVILLGGLSVLLGLKYTLQRWRSLPESPWKASSFGLGLLGLLVASLLEAPFLYLGGWVALAFAAGVIEESVKLLPLRFFRRSPEWERWKLAVGAGAFLGVAEGFLYTAGIFALDQPLYLVAVRLILVGLHTVWASVSAGFLLGGTGRGRFAGVLFSMTAHALYDLPPLAMVDGYSGTVVAVLVGLSGVFLLVAPPVAKKAAGLVGQVPWGSGGHDEPEDIEEIQGRLDAPSTKDGN